MFQYFGWKYFFRDVQVYAMLSMLITYIYIYITVWDINKEGEDLMF